MKKVTTQGVMKQFDKFVIGNYKRLPVVIVRGEGERTLRTLLDAVAQGQPLDAIPGLTFRRDGGLVRAAETAYRSTIPAGTRPSLVLELVLPADLVDVNVHPTKIEVRWRDAALVSGWLLVNPVIFPKPTTNENASNGPIPTPDCAAIGTLVWPVPL